MKRIHMVVADKDEEYIHPFARWFRENRPHQFEVTAFTEKEAFDCYLRENRSKADVVLVSEEFLTEDLNKSDILLLERPIQKEHAQMKQVEKYQSAPSIASEILSILSEWNHEISQWNQPEKSEIIVCCSPDPALKSTLALCLCLDSPDAIYINMESFPFYPLSPVNQSNQRCLSDILYHIKASRGNLALSIESTVCKDSTGINFIPAMDNPKDLWELSEAETKILVEAILSWGHFSRIVIDIAFDAGYPMACWLEAASTIIAPISKFHFYQWERIKALLQSNQGVSEEKLKFVCGSGAWEGFEKLYVVPGLEAFPVDWKDYAAHCGHISQLNRVLFGTKSGEGSYEYNQRKRFDE